ncbi:hypothetical protein BDV29DRAFT_170700 [Aspergillus leporis]|uniref:Uncharacterized protein n=1 Tax=Aspergillus leporis TaxID=41062 RepID=A0A5N5XA58_9EURO|nr:hypothetical protein BDV29DRAFT_170700 [Aspergillus leporis]
MMALSAGSRFPFPWTSTWFSPVMGMESQRMTILNELSFWAMILAHRHAFFLLAGLASIKPLLSSTIRSPSLHCC